MNSFLIHSWKLCILFTLAFSVQHDQKIIIHCNYSLEEALKGEPIPQSIRKNLIILNVEYYSFDKKLHRGQLVIHKELKKDLAEIFKKIKEDKFPIKKVIPIVIYKWNDDESMKDNNSSAFNYRKVKGTKMLSAHSTGRAIDLNPMMNPHEKKGKINPNGASYDPDIPGTLISGSFIVKEFKKRGWVWGGNWTQTKDYQHFEKK